LSASRPVALAERIERTPALDRPVRALSDAVVRALPPGTRTDALHGVPFGQPAHPALVRVPLGCWTSAVLLDLFRGTDRAARMLIGAGVAVTVPAAATGLADWSALHTDQQRVGLVHAVCQTGAAALFLGSLAARIGGRPGYGRLLSGGGLAVATAGSYLGGHLASRLGAGTSHAEQVSHLAGLGWHDLCELAELPDRRLARRQLGYLSLLVYRQDAEVSVLSDRCSHLGGPLHQGRLVVEGGETCVACPWHGSTFAVGDGRVVHGPATARQPAFEARVTAAGRVELRARPLPLRLSGRGRSSGTGGARSPGARRSTGTGSWR